MHARNTHTVHVQCLYHYVAVTAAVCLAAAAARLYAAAATTTCEHRTDSNRWLISSAACRTKRHDQHPRIYKQYPLENCFC